MVMQETCMVFRVLEPEQVLNLTALAGLFCCQIVLFVSLLIYVLFSPSSSWISAGAYFSDQVEPQFDVILAWLNVLSYYNFVAYEKHC